MVLVTAVYTQSVESVSYHAPRAVYAATEDVTELERETKTVILEIAPTKPTDVKGLIEWYADINGAPHDQAYWIAQCESELQNVPNTNGAMYGQGIYQFIQSTFDVLCEGDVWDIEDNINCGTRLIAEGKLSHWGTAYTDWGSYKCWSPHVQL